METPAAVPATPAINEAIVGQPKAATAPVTEEVTPEQTPIAKRKIPWGDKEREVTFDEAVQLAQKAFGIEEKARTAAQKADQAEKVLEMLNKDFKGFAKQCKAIGVDPQKLATEILYDQIRLNSLTPEQRELEDLKAKQAEEDAEKNAAAEAIKKADMDKKTQEWATNFEKQLQTALAAKTLPMSRLALAIAAQYIDAGLAQKKEYTVDQVLPFVARDIKNVHTATMGQLEGEDLLNYIGDDISNKIAAARVARYKKGAQPAVTTQKKPGAPVAKAEDISKLKGKAYWAALRRQKSNAGIGVFPGQEQ